MINMSKDFPGTHIVKLVDENLERITNNLREDFLRLRFYFILQSIGYEEHAKDKQLLEELKIGLENYDSISATNLWI